MKTEITDEMVEKAAKARWYKSEMLRKTEEETGLEFSWESVPEFFRERFLEDARTILEAVVDDIIAIVQEKE